MSVADNFSSELFSWGWFPQCGRDFEIKSKLCWTWILVTINFTHNVFQVRLNRTDWYRTGKKSGDERFLLFNLSRKLLIWCSQTQLIRLKPQVVYSWIKIHVTGEMWHKILIFACSRYFKIFKTHTAPPLQKPFRVGISISGKLPPMELHNRSDCGIISSQSVCGN